MSRKEKARIDCFATIIDKTRQKLDPKNRLASAVLYVDTSVGTVRCCISPRQPSTLTGKWSYPITFELNGKVISKAKLEKLLSQ